jgi:hypothetical protein
MSTTHCGPNGTVVWAPGKFDLFISLFSLTYWLFLLFYRYTATDNIDVDNTMAATYRTTEEQWGMTGRPQQGRPNEKRPKRCWDSLRETPARIHLSISDRNVLNSKQKVTSLEKFWLDRRMATEINKFSTLSQVRTLERRCIWPI